MTENTRRRLKVEKFLDEWAVVAYASPTPHPTDGTVWLRGFASREDAQGMAAALQGVMDKFAIYRAG